MAQSDEPERRLAAILAADIVGYSRMMTQDDVGTLARFGTARRDIFDPTTERFGGRIFKVMGDGLLAEFSNSVDALSAALRIQGRMAAWNQAWPADQQIVFRIGLHQGQVIVDGADLQGDGVIVAARLEPLAPAGGICISDRVREDAAGKLKNLTFKNLGRNALKNIADQNVHLVRELLPGETPPDEDAAPAARGVERDNLPAEATSFIGREDDLARVTALLQERRHITLLGSGGVGKTRAALRVGKSALPHFQDGAWLVELAPLADAGLVAEAVCRVVGAPVSGTRAPVEVAVSFMRNKQLLLILDNCEHLLNAAAELAAALLAQCPGVSILATSREPLRIAGEVVYKLPSLPVPGETQGLTAADAARFASMLLFEHRASDAAGGYRITDADAPAVARICRRLDGVAMAIELAAARMTVLKPDVIAARLENAFRLLNPVNAKKPTRQQTLWATIDWSHSLMSPEEQMLFRRLSVFVDGFSEAGAMEAAQGDGLYPDDIFDLLYTIVDKSLINADTSGATTRFRMLEATRHYAREKLKASGETGRDRFAAEYLASFYARAEATWPTSPTERWLAEFAPEVENLRAAIDWAFGQSGKYHAETSEAGDPALGLTLVARAGCIAEEMSRQADMKRWTLAAMPHVTADTPPLVEAWVCFWATKWQAVFGVREVSETRRKAIALFRAAGDKLGLSCALRTTAMAIARPPPDMPAEVEAMLAEAIELLRPLPPSKDLATALSHMGSFHAINNDYVAGRRYFADALAMQQALGDRTGVLASSLNLAELECFNGNIAAAIEGARRAVGEARRAGSAAILANLLANLAGYMLKQDDVAGARSAACEALMLNRALDHDDWSVLCLEHLALAHALAGTHAPAARLLGYTEAYFQRTDQMRDPMELAGHKRLIELLRTCMPAETLAALMAEGALWRRDQAETAARTEGADAALATCAA